MYKRQVVTYSWCDGKWIGELNTAATITKISLIYLKVNPENFPKVSVRMKDQQKSQNCTNEKEKTANFYEFNCHGHRSYTVEIEVHTGWLFDVKAYCEFKFFLLSFIKLIIIKISFKFLPFI